MQVRLLLYAENIFLFMGLSSSIYKYEYINKAKIRKKRSSISIYAYMVLLMKNDDYSYWIVEFSGFAINSSARFTFIESLARSILSNKYEDVDCLPDAKICSNSPDALLA